MLSTVRRRVITTFAAVVVALGFAAAAVPSPASASAETCVAAPGGYMCTNVSGSGGYVDYIGATRAKFDPFSGNLLGICNYNAWYFDYRPGGPVESLGYEGRAGCGLGRVWLNHYVRRTFPLGTQICAKFYENAWADFIGQRCVGLS